MGTDKRMDMSSMGDYNGVMGKNTVSRHQYHKDSVVDRPYFEKVRSFCYEAIRGEGCLVSCCFFALFCPSVVVLAHCMSALFFLFFLMLSV